MQKVLNIIIIFLLVSVVGLAIYVLLFDKVVVDKIILDKENVDIYIGEKDRLTVTILPDDAEDKTIIWSSSNPKIAVISDNGEVIALSEGETDIIVSTPNKRVNAYCHVKVMVREVQNITLSDTKMELHIGDEVKLFARVIPENATYPKINYKSSDEKIVTVDNDGIIKAINKGEAEIIVTDEKGKVEVRCKVKVGPKIISVTSVSLDKTDARLKIGDVIKLKTTITPGNATNQKIVWSSSDSSIASVNELGIITAKKSGRVVIKATAVGDKSAVCNVLVKYNPIVPNKTIYKHEGTTMKYYVENKTAYYLSYIWMDDPYNQIRKLDSSAANYGKVMSDEELSAANKSPVRKTVGQMINGYVSKGLIPSSKALIAFNASGFYVKGVWQPPTDYYHNRSSSWYAITDGKLIRNKDDGTGNSIIGIDYNGDLKIYGNSSSPEERKKIVENITNDKVKNTWSFRPTLVLNGSVIKNDNSSGAHRQGICQVDANNYIMLTTIRTMSLANMAKIFKNLGCQTAFNLDGGGSTSMFYKKAGSTSSTKIKCSDGSNHTTCRYIVDGIYFTEQ